MSPFRLIVIAFLLWTCICILLGCAATNWLEAGRVGMYTYTSVGSDWHQTKPRRVISIWVDKNFGSADLLAIDDAVGHWNYVLNGYIVLKIVDLQFDMEPSKIKEALSSDGWIFLKIDSKKADFIPKSNIDGNYVIGFCDMLSGHYMYLVRDRLLNGDITGVTMHEIGHLLGVDHVGDRLMNATFSQLGGQCIDYETVMSMASHNGIPADRLNYCVVPGDVMRRPPSSVGEIRAVIHQE